MYQVLELLRVAPADTAIAVLQDLRSRGSVIELVESVKSILAPASPPPSSSARDVLLPRTSLLSSDLSDRFPWAFPRLSPMEAANIDLRLLGLRRIPAAAAPTRPLKRRRISRGSAEAVDNFESSRSSGVALAGLPETLHVYADARLKLLEVQRWTTVAITNAYAARAISFYLTNEHPVLGFFDADLLVRDMVGEGPFCTRLLATSLLAWACVRSRPTQ